MSTVTQSRFTKGLIAVTSDQSQPKGSLPRISNMVFTRRGALKTCDGSQIISALGGVPAPGTGPWTELFLFQPVNANRYYIGIKKDLGTQLSTPGGFVIADGGAGGILGAGTYHYVVTALDGAGGETAASGDQAQAIAANHLITLSWTAVSNAISYNVYRGDVNLTNYGLLKSTTTPNITDDGSLSPQHSILPPSVNSTQTCPFFRIPVTSYNNGNQLAVFPADAIIPIDGTGGGEGGGGGGGGGSSGAPPTPQGGNVGNVSPLPQIQQFAGLAFLALGNGFAPRVYADNTAIPNWSANTAFGLLAVIKPTINNAGGFIYINIVQGVSGGAAPAPFNQTPGTNTSDGTALWRNVGTISTFAIFNTFTAVYPDWQTATGYAIGDIIKPSANNAGGFAFKAIQGGISGGAAPTFPQNTNGTVPDNKIIWQNIGIGVTSPAPRGAAHAVVYAGSLWLLNTNPTTSADGLDGPNCLKMSDLNNPFSWNPLNVAFLSKDDGDVGTGLLAFTVADTGILSTSALFAFKNFKTFQILGVFGSSNFQILEMQTDMGCIASRSISFVPGFGGMRLTHLGIAVLDGIRDKLISDDIRAYLFKEPNNPDIFPMDWNFAYFAKAAQCADPPMYICAVPIALNNLPLSTDVPPGTQAVKVVMGGNNLGFAIPTITYFIKMTRFTTLADGTVFESDISKEAAPITLTLSTQSINIVSNIGAVDAQAMKFRAYVGMSSLNYTNFREITPAQMAAGVNLFTLADFPNAGSPTNGTGGLTRLLCYDLIFKCWTIIDLPFAISVLKQVRAPGTQPITVIGGFNDGTVRRIQADDPTWDGTPVQWKFRTPEVYGDGETKRTYFRSTQIRGIGASTDAGKIAITPVYNGAPATPAQPNLYILGNNQFHITADLLVTALNANETITGQGPVEIDAVAWEAEALASGVPLTFG